MPVLVLVALVFPPLIYAEILSVTFILLTVQSENIVDSQFLSHAGIPITLLSNFQIQKKTACEVTFPENVLK